MLSWHKFRGVRIEVATDVVALSRVRDVSDVGLYIGVSVSSDVD